MPVPSDPTPKAHEGIARSMSGLADEPRALAEELRRIRRERWIALVMIGLAGSVVLHAIISIVLMSLLRTRAVVPGKTEGSILEFTVWNEPSLEDTAVAEIPPELASTATEAVPTFETLSLEPLDPQGGGEGLGSGALEAGGTGVAGDGSSTGGGLGPGGGSGAGTSFFGIGGKGRRFAYIVDISGSMSAGNRLSTAITELKRSIAALPDFASIYVCLYHSEPVPMGGTWERARPANVAKINEWLDLQSPMGGTEPDGAFLLTFQLAPPPDVIFFLTDGEIPHVTADAVLGLNGRQSRKAVVHAIAFSSDASQEQLRRIARESEGTFRFVPVSDVPRRVRPMP